MERIGKDVERQLSRGGSRDVLPLAAVTAAWRAAVGETVARNAWPARIGRDGTLHVTTTSATWAFELDRLSDEIRDGLGAALGEDVPPKLRFAVGPVPEPDAPEVPPEPQAKAASATPEVAAEAAAAAAAIEDPELRELAARAARASLGRAPSDRRF
jgi:hypothetical protein